MNGVNRVQRCVAGCNGAFQPRLSQRFKLGSHTSATCVRPPGLLGRGSSLVKRL